MVLANECFLHNGKQTQRENNYLIYDMVQMFIKVIRCKDNVLTSLVKLSYGKQNIYLYLHRSVIINAWVNGSSASKFIHLHLQH